MTPDVLAGTLPRVYPQMLEVVRSHQDADRPLLHRDGLGVPRARRGHPCAGARHGRRVRNALGDERRRLHGARLDGPFAYGEGKAQALAAVRDRSGASTSRVSWAYTDRGVRPADARVRGPSGRGQSGRRSSRGRRPAGGLAGAALREAGQTAPVPLAGAVLAAAAVGGSGSWVAARRRERGPQRGRLRCPGLR